MAFYGNKPKLEVFKDALALSTNPICMINVCTKFEGNFLELNNVKSKQYNSVF